MKGKLEGFHLSLLGVDNCRSGPCLHYLYLHFHAAIIHIYIALFKVPKLHYKVSECVCGGFMTPDPLHTHFPLPLSARPLPTDTGCHSVEVRNDDTF